MCQHTCERVGGLGLSATVLIGSAATTVAFWPDSDHDAIIGSYALAYLLVVAQAIVLPTLVCFDTRSTLVGFMAGLHQFTLTTLAGAWWLRYHYECEPSQLIPDKKHLLYRQWVHRTAYFATVMASMSVLVCVIRWTTVIMGDRHLRRDRRQAALGARRRRRQTPQSDDEDEEEEGDDEQTDDL